MKLVKALSVAALLGAAGFAFAQTAPGMTVRIIGPTSVLTGQAQKVATVQLTGGAGETMVTALPVAVSGSGLSNCSLRDNTGASVGTVSSSAIRVPGGAVVDLAYTCDVAAGASATTSVTPASVVATQNGATVTVAGAPSGTTPSATIGNGATTPGTPNTGNTGSTGTGTTPGTPNTGAGGDATTTWFILALSALVAVGAGIYTYRLSRA